MIYKQAQIDGYLKKPDTSIKAFFIYGENEGLTSELCKKIALTIVSNINDPFCVVNLLWDEIKSDVGTLFSEYNAISLMGDRRVIILRNVDNDLTKNLKELLSSKSDTLLIICGGDNFNKKSSLVQFSSDSDVIVTFACYEDRAENISSSARSFLIEKQITSSPEAFTLLCSRLSSDRKFNNNELEKLITYVGTKKHIEVDDVKAVVFDQSATGTDDLCFQTFSGEKNTALKSLKHLLNENTEAVTIIRSLTYHTQKLLEGKALAEKGEIISEVAKKITPARLFYRRNSIASQLNMWSKDRLFDILELLYKAELSCKTTNIPTEEYLSYTVLTLVSAASKLKKS
jgi:DNA polymerase-3 subunit delta